jgi:hypothetical protein
VRARDGADVEVRQDGVRELHQPDAEPVPTCLGDALDEAGRDEGPELPRDRTRGRVRATRYLVGAERRFGREDVEDRESAIGGRDSLTRWLTCAGHALSIALAGMILRITE